MSKELGTVNGSHPPQKPPANNLSQLTLVPPKTGGRNDWVIEFMTGSPKMTEWMPRTEFESVQEIKEIAQCASTWMGWKKGRIDHMMTENIMGMCRISLKRKGRKEAVQVATAQVRTDNKEDTSFLRTVNENSKQRALEDKGLKQ